MIRSAQTYITVSLARSPQRSKIAKIHNATVSFYKTFHIYLLTCMTKRSTTNNRLAGPQHTPGTDTV